MAVISGRVPGNRASGSKIRKTRTAPHSGWGMLVREGTRLLRGSEEQTFLQRAPEGTRRDSAHSSGEQWRRPEVPPPGNPPFGLPAVNRKSGGSGNRDQRTSLGQDTPLRRVGSGECGSVGIRRSAGSASGEPVNVPSPSADQLAEFRSGVCLTAGKKPAAFGH